MKPKNIFKLLLRTVILAIPLVFTTVVSIVAMLSTVLRNTACWIFNITSYWDISNEWYQITQDYESLYKIWRNGWNDW